MPNKPAIIPIGILTPPITAPSKNTEFLFCFFVAPTLDNIPKCLERSATEIAKALYIKEIDPIIIIAVTIADKIRSIFLKLSLLITP